MTRRDKIHEGVSRVLRENLRVLEGVRTKFQSVAEWFLIYEGAEHATIFRPISEGVGENVYSNY